MSTTKDRLLDAAIHEFARRGFEHATVRDICARARVNLNAVKYHFGDKLGLYRAAVTEAHTRGQRPEAPAAAGATDPREQLRSFVTGLLALALPDQQQTPPHQLLILREMASPTVATEEVAGTFIKPHFERLDSVIARLLPPSCPAIDRHLLLISVVGQCLQFKSGRHFDQLGISPDEYRQYTLPRLTEHIMRVLTAAIADCWNEPNTRLSSLQS